MSFRSQYIRVFSLAPIIACACILGIPSLISAAEHPNSPTIAADINTTQGKLIAAADASKKQSSSSLSAEQSKREKISGTTSALAAPKQKLNTGNRKKNPSAAQNNAAENSRVKEQLDKFAKHKLALINQGLRPGKSSKEVTKQNGMFVARYIQVHPKTLKTRFRRNTSNPPVRYVGFLQYQEMHYECRAETKEKALKGPFSIVRLRNMTEIIMYDNRGWHD